MSSIRNDNLLINKPLISLKPGFQDERDSDYIKEPEKRKKFEITIDQDGKCYGFDKKFNKQLLAKENILFVMDKNNTIYGVPNKGSTYTVTYNHSYLVAGEEVNGAGFIMTDENGQIICFSNNSGHYKPTREESMYFLQYLSNDIQISQYCKDNLHFEDHSRSMDGVIQKFNSSLLTIFDPKLNRFNYENEDQLKSFITETIHENTQQPNITNLQINKPISKSGSLPHNKKLFSRYRCQTPSTSPRTNNVDSGYDEQSHKNDSIGDITKTMQKQSQSFTLFGKDNRYNKNTDTSSDNDTTEQTSQTPSPLRFNMGNDTPERSKTPGGTPGLLRIRARSKKNN